MHNILQQNNPSGISVRNDSGKIILIIKDDMTIFLERNFCHWAQNVMFMLRIFLSEWY